MRNFVGTGKDIRNFDLNLTVFATEVQVGHTLFHLRPDAGLDKLLDHAAPSGHEHGE